MADRSPLVTSISIEAAATRVYDYFVDPDKIVRWMGDFARLDARPGGGLAIDVEGTPVRGEYVELDPPHRLVFSWGYAGSTELPPGASTVEVQLRETRPGTTDVTVIHTDLPGDAAPAHGRGWTMFLGILASEARDQAAV